MSIMQEYEMFRNMVGEKEIQLIEKFLDENEKYLLSDLLYSLAVWKEYEEWKKPLE